MVTMEYMGSGRELCVMVICNSYLIPLGNTIEYYFVLLVVFHHQSKMKTNGVIKR